MKKLIFKILLLSVFILVLTKSVFDPIFKKNNSFQDSIQQLYKSDKDSIDILILGSSHARNSYNTYIIDNALQLNSFSLASGGQKIVVTNNLLEDVLKEIQPKLIILDVFPGSLDYPKQSHQKSNQLQVIDNSKWSMNKLNLVADVYSFNEIPSAISPMIRNHQDWHKANWTLKNEKLDSTRAYFNKGFSGSYTVIDDEERVKLMDYTLRKENYLSLSKNEIDSSKLSDEIAGIKKAIEISKANNVQLLLVSSPYFDAFYSKLASDFHFLVKDLCEKNGINFLDFNTQFDEMKLTMDDFRDRSHVNLYGADKVTSSLVKFLSQKNYFELTNDVVKNLDKTLKSLENTFELAFEKKVDQEILPDVFITEFSVYQNKNFREFELNLNKKEGVAKLLKTHNFELVASPFDKDKQLLKGKFKKLNREVYTFYNVKDVSLNGTNKIIIRIPLSDISEYKNIRLFTFEKGNRQTSKRFTLDLPNVNLSKVIESKFEKKTTATTKNVLDGLQTITKKPFDFNKDISINEINYISTGQQNFSILFKTKVDSKYDFFDKYLGYIRYYNGEIKDANKHVKSFPLTVIENEGYKYIFARINIANTEISKFDVFFIEKETKKASKFYTIKDLKLTNNVR